jgi:hypothetical protein
MFVCESSINVERVNKTTINQSGSYPSVYPLGWTHAYRRVYEVLLPRFGQLKADGNTTLPALLQLSAINA